MGWGGSLHVPPIISPPDYVYFENSSSNPYLVRRIEELNKVGATPHLGDPPSLWGGEFPFFATPLLIFVPPPLPPRRPTVTWRPRSCVSSAGVTFPAASTVWPTATPVSWGRGCTPPVGESRGGGGPMAVSPTPQGCGRVFGAGPSSLKVLEGWVCAGASPQFRVGEVLPPKFGVRGWFNLYPLG